MTVGGGGSGSSVGPSVVSGCGSASSLGTDMAEQAAVAWDGIRLTRVAFRAWRDRVSALHSTRAAAVSSFSAARDTRRLQGVIRAWKLASAARKMAVRRHLVRPFSTWRAIAEVAKLQRRREHLAVEFRRRQLAGGTTTIRGDTDCEDDVAHALAGRGMRLLRGTQ